MNFFNENNQQQDKKAKFTSQFTSLINTITEYKKEYIALRELERLIALFDDDDMYLLRRYCAKKDESNVKRILMDMYKQSDFTYAVTEFININQDHLPSSYQQHQTYLISVIENDSELKSHYNTSKQNQVNTLSLWACELFCVVRHEALIDL